jgi:hypothetical protein
MLAGLCELPVLVLDFVEQSYVLDRDSGLVRESIDQLDLLVGKRLHRRSRHIEYTDRDALPHRGSAALALPLGLWPRALALPNRLMRLRFCVQECLHHFSETRRAPSG